MLEIKDLTSTFSENDHFVLGPISMELRTGEIGVIMGRSGSGKTTLQKCISGHLPFKAQKISWKGNRIKGPDEVLVPGNTSIQRVDQEFDLMPFSRVRDNLRKYVRHLEEEDQDARVSEMLRILDMEGFTTRFPRDLSGGEKQRLSIGRSLLADPELLLLDEPFSQLDQHHKVVLLHRLRDYARAHDLALLFNLHHPEDAFLLADRIWILEGGHLSEGRSPNEWLDDPKKFSYAELFGSFNRISEEQARSIFERIPGRTIEGEWLIWPWEIEEKNLLRKPENKVQKVLPGRELNWLSWGEVELIAEVRK